MVGRIHSCTFVERLASHRPEGRTHLHCGVVDERFEMQKHSFGFLQPKIGGTIAVISRTELVSEVSGKLAANIAAGVEKLGSLFVTNTSNISEASIAEGVADKAEDAGDKADGTRGKAEGGRIKLDGGKEVDTLILH
ncbi:hypothetical protein VNO78_34174 [Psophocarpus tetragonolobus]|uniref:Uncharacterized protein n=1 Tax=Psophocarpus tetragonolobus TaxID=3891 RepID=A0AAN9P2F3_PSOTE